MKNHFGTRRTGLILAADLPTLEQNMAVIEQVRDVVDVIKIGSPLVYGEGMQVIRRLKDRFGIPVFADLKVSDVPHTNAKIIRQVVAQGGDAVMVHGIVGPDGLADAVEAADGKLGIIVQLELTNPGGKLFTQPIADDMAAMGASQSVYGFQAPGNRPERVATIRRIVGAEPVIVCCGVGHQGGACGSVFAAGANYAIVGRAIYNAARPRQAAADVLGGGSLGVEGLQ
jgi:orotidine-5'-phosphate decarboxylase